MRRLTLLTAYLLAALAGCAYWPRHDAAPAAATAAPAVASTPAPAAVAGPESAPSPPRTSHAGARAAYLAPGDLDLYRLLPPPPAAGSVKEREELDELLSIQAHRTQAEVARAQADQQQSVFRFADALGNPPAFVPTKLPLTVQLFRAIGDAESVTVNPVKDAWARPRPFLTEKRLKPVDDRPPSASYPSGHSTWATAVGIVLADMVPEYRAGIFARAEEFAYHREVGGVHYPSDVAAGHLAGTVLAAQLFASSRFRSDEAAAVAELRTALGLPALPPRHTPKSQAGAAGPM